MHRIAPLRILRRVVPVRMKRWFYDRSNRRLNNVSWHIISANGFELTDKGLKLITDDSDWGYQLSSLPIAIHKDFHLVAHLRGHLTRGALSLGMLDESGQNWICNVNLPAGLVDERIVFEPGDSRTVKLVFSNAQGGESELILDSIRLELVPPKTAQRMGGVEAIIAEEIQSVIDKASPVPLPLPEGPPCPSRPLAGTGVYLRTDYWVKIRAGGSYGHTCYVAEQLSNCTENLVCYMANNYELLDEMGLRQEILPKPSNSCNEIDVMRSSRFYYEYLYERLKDLKPTYIYERLILGNYAGARLSQELGIPYILEYNGSEISLKRSFDDNGYEHELIFTLAEKAAFEQATAIIAVSEIVAQGLIKQGVDSRKILINPNGCSPDDYKPIDSTSKQRLRNEFGWSDNHCVIGFIGTFGGWHGIDILSESLHKICELVPEARFLLIGDGNFRHLIDDALKTHHLKDRVHLTGAVPQHEGRRLLGAADIYISPHSRNMIDSRFFGSPTKLFEYMAMGGVIVASDLEQIGEVLRPGFSASDLDNNIPLKVTKQRGVLAVPGDVDDFVKAVVGISRQRSSWKTLGLNARQALIESYSWKSHVERTWKHISSLTI